MATSRREPQPHTRTNRPVRNMSPVQKTIESDQGLLRRARSVPTSPDRRRSASTAAASSSNACRPSSSVNPRSAAPSRSATSGSASSSSSPSSTHGKALPHSVPAMVGAKQAAGVVRRRADKPGPGATSVWPHALTTTPSTAASPVKDPASRTAKPPSSNAQKSKLSARKPPAASPPKPRTQKAPGAAAGRTQAASSLARNPGPPGAMAKRRTGLETSVPSIQRTTSVPAAAPKADEQDVELLMEEFNEMDCISTPSIEEHLQERLPDPVDFAAYATQEDAPSQSGPASSREDHQNGQEVVQEHTFSEGKTMGMNGGGNAGAGLDIDREVVVAEEAVNEAELEESVGETELNETVPEVQLKEAVDDPKLNEDGSGTELKDPALAVKEEAKANDLTATKTPETVQRWRKDDGRSNGVADATEQGRGKTTMQQRRNKVMALVGRFETAMSGRE